jgi:CheY-like chemotaxis protein/anti-sigma regulatory factor (Ser/Thr protein kinase)
MTPLDAPVFTPDQDWREPQTTIEVTVLVVDDNPVDRRLAGAIVEKRLSWRAIYASDGAEVLPLLRRESPSLVLTDMLMPEMGGLELVEALRSHSPQLPVVLMTAYGSEDIAMQALQRGAASYVAKRNLPTDLTETLRRVLAAANRDRRQRRLLQCLTEVESQFALDNEPSLVPIAVAHVQEQLASLNLCDEAEMTRVGIALEEALLNGLYHGNLECGRELQGLSSSDRRKIVWERCTQPPYRDRRLWFRACLSQDQAAYTVRDEGPGFDPAALPDPTDPASLTGNRRGLVLIRTFMDEVKFNARGNEITLVKHRRGTRGDNG